MGSKICTREIILVLVTRRKRLVHSSNSKLWENSKPKVTDNFVENVCISSLMKKAIGVMRINILYELIMI